MNVCIPIKWLVAFTLLMAVLAVFISPAFDIPDTTLFAKSLAQLILLVLIALASLPAGSLIARTVVGVVAHDFCFPTFAPSVSLVLPLLC
jgi:hypothetical protein